ncbi:MAG: NADH-quinone oxidoreductase subunit M [Chitinophagaceae bacterium]|nr:NADH-quinone oxidoreductase subunit M [Chitinophagaceae bacterium]
MIPVLLIFIPLLAGVLTFFFRSEKAVRSWSLGISFVTMAVAVIGVTIFDEGSPLLTVNTPWLQTLGSSFFVRLDGLGKILTLLTAISFPVIFTSTWSTPYKRSNNFYALMLLGQAGLMGVFVAADALLFYFFWELALIPMYFIASIWGGEKRIRVTFKFFIYTFIGSVLMLIGILYLQSKTANHSFSIQAFNNLQLSLKEQSWLFWLFFIAFAIKMPIFPLHTWQPDTYEQSPTAATMVLSGVMVKMGLLGIIRWVMPVMPAAFHSWGDVAMSLSVIGIVYASLIAMRQDDLKRLIAFSSIAHIGLMNMALFSENISGVQGAILQMFNHGINIIGLWAIVEIIERKTGTRKMSELGGLAQKAPAMAVFFVVIALANIALPLTNSFPGEFLMFNSLLTAHTTRLYALLFTVFAGLGIILGAVYTLNMIRKTFYGETNTVTAGVTDLSLNEKIALSAVVILVIVIGVYPQLLLDITNNFSEMIANKDMFRKA